jgi:hypothetical protein
MRVTKQLKADVTGKILLETIECTVVAGKELYRVECQFRGCSRIRKILTSFLNATSFPRVSTRASNFAFPSCAAKSLDLSCSCCCVVWVVAER